MSPLARTKILAAFAIALFPATVLAAPRDKSAEKYIEKAINEHYLATEFDKAESVLEQTIKACEDRCSAEVKAKAFMYQGIVKGSGKGDIAAAKEMFAQACALDPNVKLDEGLATPETTKAFADAGCTAGTGAVAATEVTETTETGEEPAEAPEKPAAGAEPEGEMECTPEAREVQVRRPIPIACQTDEPATQVELSYKPFGGEKWEKAEMQRRGGFWQAEIPCAATGVIGPVQWYIKARDRGGDTVDSYGTKKGPVEIQILNSTAEEAPHAPGRPAPSRCSDTECPPDFPGCKKGGAGGGGKAWGATCNETSECEEGLACLNGTCENPPPCDSDADCQGGGVCSNGLCKPGGESGDEPKKEHAWNWIGAHFGIDLALMSGQSVCSPEAQATNNYACFKTGTEEPYPANFGALNPTKAGNISGGIAPATMRPMLSYERVLVGNLGAELRAGYAIGGGPTPPGGAKFMPIHAEVRGKLWFGQNVFSKKGIRPWIHAGGGMAQVDSKITVSVGECADSTNPVPVGDPTNPSPAPQLRPHPVNTAPFGEKTTPDGKPPTKDPSELIARCQAQSPFPTPPAPGSQTIAVDAYKKLGQGFVVLGGGGMFAFKENMGLLLNLNMMIMLPSTGLVIEPSLGLVFGL